MIELFWERSNYIPSQSLLNPQVRMIELNNKIGEKIKKSTAIMDQMIAYSQMGIPSNVNLPKFRNWW